MGCTSLLYGFVFFLLIIKDFGKCSLYYGKENSAHLSDEQACYTEDVGCFSTGVPFYHPVFRPNSELPDRLVKAKFLLFDKMNLTKREELIPTLESLRRTQFSSDIGTKVIIPGYMTTMADERLFSKLKNALLENGDWNVIVVDWTNFDHELYFQAVANARVIGAQLAALLQFLHVNAEVDLESVHLIGHGLGAHIAGWAGERLENLGRISGLDPAGPYFHSAEDIIRLDPTDAHFIDIIHTDGGTDLINGMGILAPIGHIDFYPNGGVVQPGCSNPNSNDKKTSNETDRVEGSGIHLKFTQNSPHTNCTYYPSEQDKCSHMVSIEIFISSVKDDPKKFLATPCDSWEAYKAGECKHTYRKYRKSELHTMGLNSTMYYFTTTSQKYYLDFDIGFPAPAVRVSETPDSEETSPSVLEDTETSSAP